MLKWAAFRDRGEDDFHGSHDVEDIFALMASRPTLRAECEQLAELDIRAALAQMARTLFTDEHDFGDLLAGHIKIEPQRDVRAVYRLVQETVRALAHLDRNDSEGPRANVVGIASWRTFVYAQRHPTWHFAQPAWATSQ